MGFSHLTATLAPIILVAYSDGIHISDAVFDCSWAGEVPYVERLKPSEIWQAFFVDSVPIKTSLPALLEIHSRWTNEYLISRFGDVLVQTEHDRENRTTDYCGMERLGSTVQCSAADFEYMREVKKLTTLKDYVSNMTAYPDTFNRYVISMLAEEMASELPFLPGFSCGLQRFMAPIDSPSDPMHATEIHEMNFWLSKGGTVSTLHYDMNHQIMCQIDGHKDWRFWDLRTELDHIPMWSGYYSTSYQSDDAPIDPLNVDLEKFSDFVNAKWYNTTLSPGECLLIPNRHWLHVVLSHANARNMGFSVHVSVDKHNTYSVYDCDSEVEELEFSKLEKYEVSWPFPGDSRESGFNQVRMGMHRWKPVAVYAMTNLVKHKIPLVESVRVVTNNRINSRINQMLREAEAMTDAGRFTELLHFAPFWRDVVTLAHNM